MMASCHVGYFNVVISTGILRSRFPRNAQSPVCPAQDRYGISVLASKRCAARIDRDRQRAAAWPDAAQQALSPPPSAHSRRNSGGGKPAATRSDIGTALKIVGR